MAEITLQEIKDSLKRAKWSNEKARMSEAEKYLDYYNYRQDSLGYSETNDKQTSYMRDRIAERFPLTQADMFPYISTYPITEQIINDISIMFNNPPAITINPEQKLAEDDAKVLLFKDEIIDKPMLYPNLVAVNRYTNLLGKVGVMPRWYEAGGELEYVILTPDKCFVFQDPDSPSHITAVIYQVDNMEDTPHSVHPVDEWFMITDTERVKLKIGRNVGDVKIVSSEPNPYGMINVAWFQNNIPLSGFWNKKGNPIVEANEGYNINKTLEKLCITYQMYSTLVTIDVPNESTLTWGVKAVLNMHSDSTNDNIRPDAKYITPDPKLEQVSGIIEGEINAIAGYAGLSEEAYRKKTNSFTSGYHLELSKQDVINQNEMEIPFYTSAIKKLLEIACTVYTKHAKNTLDTVKTYTIDYQPLSFKKNPLEVWQIRTIEKLNKMGSPVDWLMEDNPELSREDAIERLKQIESDIKEFASSPMLNSMSKAIDDEDNEEDV